MKVLVACEFSGRVRDAFLARGHDAISCDLIPSEQPGPHYRGDVRDILDQGWDLMIAHPPCTYLTKAGVRWLHSDPDRWALMVEGAEFFRTLLHAPIPHIAIENPVMHRHATDIIGVKQDYIIQPWMFGHVETKSTGLWLKNLPRLYPTKNVQEQLALLPKAQQQRTGYMGSKTPDRPRKRSITHRGIAEAMATQWGELELVP